MIIVSNFLAENDPKRSRNIMEPLRTPKTVRKMYKTPKIPPKLPIIHPEAAGMLKHMAVCKSGVSAL